METGDTNCTVCVVVYKQTLDEEQVLRVVAGEITMPQVGLGDDGQLGEMLNGCVY